MRRVVLYTTGCPRCRVLERKLDEAGISYAEEEDVNYLVRIGMKSAPALEVDGRLLDFSEALLWVSGLPGERRAE